MSFDIGADEVQFDVVKSILSSSQTTNLIITTFMEVNDVVSRPTSHDFGEFGNPNVGRDVQSVHTWFSGRQVSKVQAAHRVNGNFVSKRPDVIEIHGRRNDACYVNKLSTTDIPSTCCIQFIIHQFQVHHI